MRHGSSNNRVLSLAALISFLLGTFSAHTAFAQQNIDFVGPIAVETFGVSRYTLDNGMDVILRPLDTLPYVCVVVLYDIGDQNDPPAKSGLGRLMNRLYVTAATDHMRARSVEEWRGLYPFPKACSGLVGEDFFVVGSLFDDVDLPRELSEAADRMRNLKITRNDVDRELPEVINNINMMNGRNPPSGAFTELREMLHPSGNEARWGGVTDQIMTVTQADVESYLNYLKPRNATISIIGRFKEPEVRRMIQEQFGSIPSGSPVPARAQSPAPSLGQTKRVTVETDEGQWHGRTMLSMGFRAPPPNDPLYPAWQVLVGYFYLWMANPESAPGGASPISPAQVQYRTVEDPSMLQVAAVLNVGANEQAGLAQLRRFVDKTIESIDNYGNTLIEPARGAFTVLGIADATDESMTENVYGVAFGMGRLQQMGLGTGGKLVADLENVTIDDLKRCAAKFLSADNSATVILRVAAPGERPTPAQ